MVGMYRTSRCSNNTLDDGEQIMTTRTLRWTSFSALSLLLAATVGCMVEPGDGKILSKRSESIRFAGWALKPNQSVVVKALNQKTGIYEPIGTTKTTNVTYDHFGTTWYRWQLNRVVPNDYWVPFFGNHMAEVKATIDNTDALCWEEGFYNYMQDYSSLQEMYEEHHAAGETSMFIFASE